MIHSLSDDDFQNYLKEATLPVVIDFWAPFCGPCRLLAPILEVISESLKETVLFTKINVEECPEAASLHKIRHLPTLLLVHGGQEKGRLVGLQAQEALTAWISESLA